MPLHTKRYEPVIERMSLKHETTEPIEQCDTEDVRNPRLHSAILRRRIKGIVGIVLIALVYAIYIYYRSTYLRNSGAWSWFWVGEAFVGVWLVFAVTQVLKKKPKL
jgi:hypothetical protein